MRIQSLEIEAFRGFNEKQKFEFPKVDILILYGPNGHGKTSFFDAIEWVITGKIFRYNQKSQERNQSKFVGNKFSETLPCVSIEFVSDSGEYIKLTRKGIKTGKSTDYGDEFSECNIEINDKDYNGDTEEKLKELLINKEWLETTSLESGLQVTHLLGQERMNHILRGMEDKERYDNFSTLFGTEQFNRYQTYFKNAQSNLQTQEKDLITKIAGINEKVKNDKDLLDTLKVKYHLSNNDKEIFFHKIYQLFSKEFNTELDKSDLEHLNILSNDLNKLKNELESQLFKVDYEEQQINVMGKELDSWAAKSLDIKSMENRLEKLEEFNRLSELIGDIEWLYTQSDFFIKNSFKNEELLKEIDEKKYQIEIIEKELKYSIEDQNELKSMFRAAYKENNFMRMQLDMSLFKGIGKQFSFEYKDLINLLERIINISFHIKQESDKFEFKNKMHKDLLKQLEQFKIIDYKYKEMLQSIQSFMHEQSFISECPSCGTEGIDKEKILNYTKSKQMDISPEFSRLNNDILNLENELNLLKINNESEVAEFNRLIQDFEKKLSEIDKRLKKEKGFIVSIRREVSALYNEIESNEELNVKFRKLSGKLGVNLDNGSTKKEIALKKQDLVLARLSLKSELLIEESDAIIQANYLKKMIIESKEIKNNLISKLIKYRIISDNENISLEKEKIDPLKKIIKNSLYKNRADFNHIQDRVNKVIDGISYIEKQQKSEEITLLEERIKEDRMKLSIIEKEKIQTEKDLVAVKEIIQKIPVAIENLNQKVMDSLFDTIQSIYERLNSHPIYQVIEYKQKQSHNKNRLSLSVDSRDSLKEELKANPSFIFSSAQICTVALSFFLAMATRQQWSPLKLIAMDDPIQSMDDLNVVSLTDFLRVLVKPEHGKQLVLSTHDLTFLQLMLKKFRFIKIGIIEYEGYTDKGPTIKQYVDDLGMSFPIKISPGLPKEMFNKESFLEVLSNE